MAYECKFCFEEGNDSSEFISPCCCTGSMLHVHKTCLNKWLSSEKGTEQYFKCKDCHCRYNRTSPENLDSTIHKKLTFSTLIASSFAAFMVTVFILGCGVSLLFCNVILIVLYLMTICYLSFYGYYNAFWIAIILLLTALYCGKYKTFIVDLWLISLFAVLSFHFINEGWQMIDKIIKKDCLMNFKAKMFDKFTNKYVGGVI